MSDELAHAREVGFGLGRVGARRDDVRVERRALPGCVLHHGLGLAFHAASTGRRARRGEIRIGLRELHGELALVDAHERGVRANAVVLGDVHRGDVAAHLREHGNEVAVHLRVVGGLVRAAVEPLLRSPGDTDDRGDDDEPEDDPALVARRWRRIDVDLLDGGAALRLRGGRHGVMERARKNRRTMNEWRLLERGDRALRARERNA